MAGGSADQGTDGDEVMQKGGETISKFSKEALEIGASVSGVILKTPEGGPRINPRKKTGISPCW